MTQSLRRLGFVQISKDLRSRFVPDQSSELPCQVPAIPCERDPLGLEDAACFIAEKFLLVDEAQINYPGKRGTSVRSCTAFSVVKTLPNFLAR